VRTEPLRLRVPVPENNPRLECDEVFLDALLDALLDVLLEAFEPAFEEPLLDAFELELDELLLDEFELELDELLLDEFELEFEELLLDELSLEFEELLLATVRISVIAPAVKGDPASAGVPVAPSAARAAPAKVDVLKSRVMLLSFRLRQPFRPLHPERTKRGFIPHRDLLNFKRPFSPRPRLRGTVRACRCL
jgi:hypothetical protein